MSAQPVRATIFAYQVGFGDCFLVRFTYDDQSRRHMLIDFGTTSLPEDAPKGWMVAVANDIAAKCRENGHSLDVVVATHRHADHISGFATGSAGDPGPGDIIAALKPRAIVQPWTEAPTAPLDWLGPEKSASKNAFNSRRASLAAMQDTAAAALAQLTKHPSAFRGLSRELAFIGEDNLSNLSAVRNLQKMGKAGRELFVFHGCKAKLGAELPNIGVTVLGPPTLRQTETIRKQRSKDEDEFWHLAALNLGRAAGTVAARPLFPGAETISGKKIKAEHRWLAYRLRETNAELTLSLVRALDKQMNNTSVILLLKAGNKSLLFAGDAQLENWQYALQSPLAPLLDQVDLYKVGHHGSLNATPKSMWRRFAKKGPKGTPGRLTSVMSTKGGKHGSKGKGTEVPRKPLVDELDLRSTLVSTESLPDGELYRKVEIDLA
jgi:hypothetical protein